MNQPLNRIPIIVQHEHHWPQAQLQQVRERLHGQVQAALAGDEDTALESPRLADRFEGAHGGARRVPDAAEDGLVVHAGAAGEFGAPEAEGGGARFADQEVAGLEEFAEGLWGC